MNEVKIEDIAGIKVEFYGRKFGFQHHAQKHTRSSSSFSVKLAFFACTIVEVSKKHVYDVLNKSGPFTVRESFHQKMVLHHFREVLPIIDFSEQTISSRRMQSSFFIVNSSRLRSLHMVDAHCPDSHSLRSKSRSPSSII